MAENLKNECLSPNVGTISKLEFVFYMEAFNKLVLEVPNSKLRNFLRKKSTGGPTGRIQVNANVPTVYSVPNDVMCKSREFPP